jgi:hypothetical protein
MNSIFLNWHTYLVILLINLNLCYYLKLKYFIKVLVTLGWFYHFIIQFASKNQNFRLFYFILKEVFSFLFLKNLNLFNLMNYLFMRYLSSMIYLINSMLIPYQDSNSINYLFYQLMLISFFLTTLFNYWFHPIIFLNSTFYSKLLIFFNNFICN